MIAYINSQIFILYNFLFVLKFNGCDCVSPLMRDIRIKTSSSNTFCINLEEKTIFLKIRIKLHYENKREIIWLKIIKRHVLNRLILDLENQKRKCKKCTSEKGATQDGKACDDMCTHRMSCHVDKWYVPRVTETIHVDFLGVYQKKPWV